jgi:hypothetical protein
MAHTFCCGEVVSSRVKIPMATSTKLNSIFFEMGCDVSLRLPQELWIFRLIEILINNGDLPRIFYILGMNRCSRVVLATSLTRRLLIIK